MTFGEAVLKPGENGGRGIAPDAVVIHGPRGLHFEDEVLSWHHINGSPAEEILPAILITTRHPRTFREVFGPGAAFTAPADALLLIPLRKTCKTPDEVVALSDRLFRDVAAKKALSNYTAAKEIRRGVGTAIVDALVVQPKVAGIGLDLGKLALLQRRAVSVIHLSGAPADRSFPSRRRSVRNDPRRSPKRSVRYTRAAV
jgi:hypothetical protein